MFLLELEASGEVMQREALAEDGDVGEGLLLQALALEGGDAASYRAAYDQFASWVDASLDMYKVSRVPGHEVGQGGVLARRGCSWGLVPGARLPWSSQHPCSLVLLVAENSWSWLSCCTHC